MIGGRTKKRPVVCWLVGTIWEAGAFLQARAATTRDPDRASDGVDEIGRGLRLKNAA